MENIAKQLQTHIKSNIDFAWSENHKIQDIPHLLALLFTYWTINSSPKSDDENDEEIEAIDFDTLKKPHCI